MKCIFICVFNQEKYIDLFNLLLKSIHIYGNLDKNTHILVYTSTLFMNIIKQNILFDEHIRFEINDTYDDIDKACKSRLDLFELNSVSKYKRILYLDTDIIIKKDINKVFDIITDDILYALEEGTIDSPTDYWGKTLFNEEIANHTDKSAFTSGILLFNNCKKIMNLFVKIKEDIIARPYSFDCYDQPYIIYNAFKYNLYDNQKLKMLAINNDYNLQSDIVIHHFPGGPGIYENKIINMTHFLNKMNRSVIYNTNKSPIKNTSFSLIGICVSYNYNDTLQFTLPVNYLHFEKMYVITHPTDKATIKLCNKYNVKLLFYNFKNNKKKFDKYGALNYAQELVYRYHPDSWYLNIDSDIILPNNFIDIIIKENLNPDCIYGAIRNNIIKTSELLDKTQIVTKKNLEWVYNNILYLKNKPPSILGSFQLYKKKCYHRDNIDNAGFGDYLFGHDNFKLFCNLDNLFYIHLGKPGINWDGKIESFKDDINIKLSDIYYICDKKCNNIYYNDACQLVKYGNSKNIDDDVWTCSEKMRYDIYDFFKDTSFKIAEIGAHKGYTTSILANIFSVVYAVDNNIEWTDFNKELNKDFTNIKYVNLDIYKENWAILPTDIEVSFIDAMHTYEHCRMDIINSIQRFNSLQYIIFDDYGVWSGVKKIVDELISNKILLFERYIGINNVPGPNGIVHNVHEGIICKINKTPVRKEKMFRLKFI